VLYCIIICFLFSWIVDDDDHFVVITIDCFLFVCWIFYKQF
jgi:hypothetical protein